MPTAAPSPGLTQLVSAQVGGVSSLTGDAAADDAFHSLMEAWAVAGGAAAAGAGRKSGGGGGIGAAGPAPLQSPLLGRLLLRK
jgi:hypothetical protein